MVFSEMILVPHEGQTWPGAMTHRQGQEEDSGQQTAPQPLSHQKQSWRSGKEEYSSINLIGDSFYSFYRKKKLG